MEYCTRYHLAGMLAAYSRHLARAEMEQSDNDYDQSTTTNEKKSANKTSEENDIGSRPHE